MSQSNMTTKFPGPQGIVMSNYIKSVLFAIVYSQILSPGECSRVRQHPVINQLRTQATRFQQQGDLEHPETKQELTAFNRWL